MVQRGLSKSVILDFFTPLLARGVKNIFDLLGEV